MPSIVFYISGHGFGHASRQIEILNAVGSAAPALRLVVRTSAPAWLFERTMRVPYTRLAGDTDTGIVQIDALRLHERVTIQRAASFHRTLDARAAEEAAALDAHDAVAIIADAPPLGPAAAAAAGIPAFVVSNFTWDWIYEEYREHLSEAPGLVPTLRRAYGLAWEGWRLPMHGGFESVPTVRDVPFVARHAGHDPGDVRRMLGLPAAGALALSSFGGYGVEAIDLTSLDCLDLCGVVLTTHNRPTGPLPRGVWSVSESVIYGQGLRYEDLVRAVEVVVTKPGYGIISECIANDTAVLYTSRGRFAEYHVLTHEMPRFLRCGFIGHEALFAGRWRESLASLLQAPPPPERPRTDGAHVVAQMILERL